MMVSSKLAGSGRGRLARAAAVGVGLLVAMVVFAGCAKKNRLVDPGFTMPMGTLSQDARLVIWYDAETVVSVYEDLAPIGPSASDTLIGTESHRVGVPGDIHGMIFDHTAATEFQVFRREANGGLYDYQDFTLRPTRRWLPNEWEEYHVEDPAPTSFSPSTYIARGLVNGVVSDQSPLTNMAELSSMTLPDIAVSAKDIKTAGVDTVGTIDWADVPGAAGYWVQIYEFRSAPTNAKILSGLPTPIYDEFTADDLVMFVTGATDYTMGDTTRADVEILFYRRLLAQSDPSYVQPLVRVTAVDGTGRIIAYSRGSNETARFSDTSYGVFRLGALQLDKLRVPRPPAQ